ncbi:MAG: M28 family peptidase [Ignavibacteriales bacterium]|nr:M28 family peptidase [Ignavibacteriales bacterium]
MMKLVACLCLVLAFLCPTFGQSHTPFSTDSAAAYLRIIAVDIGARPMGSANERTAMEFAIRKFREFGLSDAYIMPIAEYPGFLNSPPTNTRSGVAVGVLRGATSRIIVLGAHMDSVDPSVPGANDDGSGSAAVIELARVLSQRKNQSTIIFALFGGEEAGDQGSHHFVKNFADTNRIALMLQLDMANGSPLLIPIPDRFFCIDGRHARRRSRLRPRTVPREEYSGDRFYIRCA